MLRMLALPAAIGSAPAVQARMMTTARVALAPPSEVVSELPQARLLGGGRLRFMLFHVYDARLWVAPGFEVSAFERTALALELQYARTLYGALIAERSLEEMRRGGEIAADKADRWLQGMKRAFPDVNEGDRLTGVLQPGVGTRFYFNGKLNGEIRDPEFSRLFFGIWLSSWTSEPRLREALLAGPSGGT